MLVPGEEDGGGDSVAVSALANAIALAIMLLAAAFFGSAFVRLLVTLAEAGWRWAS